MLELLSASNNVLLSDLYPSQQTLHIRHWGIPASSAPGTSYQEEAVVVRQQTQTAPTQAEAGRQPSPEERFGVTLTFADWVRLTCFGVVRYVDLLQLLLTLHCLHSLLLDVPIRGLPHVIILN